MINYFLHKPLCNSVIQLLISLLVWNAVDIHYYDRYEIIQSWCDRILWDLYAYYYVCKSGKLIKCRSNFCSAISHNHDVRLTPDRHVNQTDNWQPDYAPWTTDSNNLLFSHEDIRMNQVRREIYYLHLRMF